MVTLHPGSDFYINLISSVRMPGVQRHASIEWEKFVVRQKMFFASLKHSLHESDFSVQGDQIG
jgi:hypothetical protein